MIIKDITVKTSHHLLTRHSEELLKVKTNKEIFGQRRATSCQKSCHSAQPLTLNLLCIPLSLSRRM